MQTSSPRLTSSPRPAKASLVAVLAAVQLVAGCASSSDPRDGGFVNGLHGILGGDYQKRIDDRERELSQLKDTKVGLDRQRQDVDAAQKAAAAEADLLQAELLALARESAASRAQMDALLAKRRRSSDRLAALLLEQQSIERELDSLRGLAPSAARGIPGTLPAPTTREKVQAAAIRQKRLNEALRSLESID